MASIFIRCAILYALLSLVMRGMGKRQLGQLDVSELVTTLLVSEIAAIPIDDPDIPLLGAVIPMVFIASAEILLSALKNKSGRLKRIFEGSPTFVIFRGKIREQVLRENRISVNELLAELRQLNVFDVSDVEYAILEAGGRLSVLQKAEAQPLSREIVEQNDGGMAHPLIIDGEVQTGRLRDAGKNENYLSKLLEEAEVSEADVLLLTVNDKGEVNLVKCDSKRRK